MKSYNVSFSYSVLVEAENEDEAYEIALDNYVSQEDFHVTVDEMGE
jgi:hypothetical protein